MAPPLLCRLHLHAWGLWFRFGRLADVSYRRRICKRRGCEAEQVKAWRPGSKTGRGGSAASGGSAAG